MKPETPTIDRGYNQRLPGGVPSILKDLPERYFVRGRDGRCWTDDGTEYVDFICGFGPLILGHCNAEVNESVVEQMNRGMLFASISPLHNELAAVLRRIFPQAESSIFLKTGSEAVSAAIRLARAFTGKSKIIRCGFHGWHDAFISPHFSWHNYEPDCHSPRTVPGVHPIGDDPFVFSWNGVELEQLKSILHAHRDIAALILDPVQLQEPIGSNLEHLRELTREEGVLFILDEIKTGFRVSIAGVQGLYDVRPDLTILSKAISNGFPLSVVTGRAEIISLSSDTRIMGTFNNELLAIAAALRTISVLERPDTLPSISKAGGNLIDGVNSALLDHGLFDDVRAVPYRWPCMPFIWFRNASEFAQQIKPVIYQQLLQRRVLWLANHMNFICATHTRRDIEQFVTAFRESLRTSFFNRAPA